MTSRRELARDRYDHIILQSKIGTDHIDNLQLLCAHCTRTKDNRPQEYLSARLKETGIAI